MCTEFDLAMFCGKHNLYDYLQPYRIVPQTVLNLLVSKGSFWVIGAVTGLSLLVEDKRRRAELTMYVLPKGLESAWITARGKGLVIKTGEVGEALVRLPLSLINDSSDCFIQMTAVGMGMVMVSCDIIQFPFCFNLLSV